MRISSRKLLSKTLRLCFREPQTSIQHELKYFDPCFYGDKNIQTILSSRSFCLSTKIENRQRTFRASEYAFMKDNIHNISVDSRRLPRKIRVTLEKRDFFFDPIWRQYKQSGIKGDLLAEPRCCVKFLNHERRFKELISSVPYLNKLISDFVFTQSCYDSVEAIKEHTKRLDRLSMFDEKVLKHLGHAAAHYNRNRVAADRHAEEIWVPFYTKLWKNSHDLAEAASLKQVIGLVYLWNILGLKPANLQTLLFTKVNANPSKELLMYCLMWKATLRGIGLPHDDTLFNAAEDYFYQYGHNSSMTELLLISEAFFRSQKPFMKHALPNTFILQERFMELLSSGFYPWTPQHHVVLKQLRLNTGRRKDQMDVLCDALEKGGFFEYCASNVSQLFHELNYLLNFLVTRRRHDRVMLQKMEKVLLDYLRNPANSKELHHLRSKDLSRVMRGFASLSYKPDPLILDKFIDSLRKKTVPMKEIYGVSILISIEALALWGIYPHDIIESFFTSQHMVLENGNLKYFHGDNVQADPWYDLVNYDMAVKYLCPDYKGPQMPDELVRVAKQKFIELMEQDGTVDAMMSVEKYRPEIPNLIKAINTLLKKEVAYSDPLSVTNIMTFIIFHLDANNKPLLPKVDSRRRKRSIAIILLRKNQVLDDSGSDELLIRPEINMRLAVVRAQGYEVFVVDNNQGFRLVDAFDDYLYNYTYQLLDHLNVAGIPKIKTKYLSKKKA